MNFDTIHSRKKKNEYKIYVTCFNREIRLRYTSHHFELHVAILFKYFSSLKTRKWAFFISKYAPRTNVTISPMNRFTRNVAEVTIVIYIYIGKQTKMVSFRCPHGT